MKKDDCIFCKLANGDIPTNSIYEDDNFNVILDASPSSKGHALILPKNHANDLFELSDDDASKVLIVAKKVAASIKKTLDCPGINILQNNGEAAGQTVMHYHVHIIPRYENDTVNVAWSHCEVDDKDNSDFIKAVKTNL